MKNDSGWMANPEREKRGGGQEGRRKEKRGGRKVYGGTSIYVDVPKSKKRKKGVYDLRSRKARVLQEHGGGAKRLKREIDTEEGPTQEDLCYDKTRNLERK